MAREPIRWTPKAYRWGRNLRTVAECLIIAGAAYGILGLLYVLYVAAWSLT